MASEIFMTTVLSKKVYIISDHKPLVAIVN